MNRQLATRKVNLQQGNAIKNFMNTLNLLKINVEIKGKSVITEIIKESC